MIIINFFFWNFFYNLLFWKKECVFSLPWFPILLQKQRKTMKWSHFLLLFEGIGFHIISNETFSFKILKSESVIIVFMKIKQQACIIIFLAIQQNGRNNEYLISCTRKWLECELYLRAYYLSFFGDSAESHELQCTFFYNR